MKLVNLFKRKNKVYKMLKKSKNEDFKVEIYYEGPLPSDLTSLHNGSGMRNQNLDTGIKIYLQYRLLEFKMIWVKYG